MLQYIAGTVKVRSNEADCMYSGIMVDTNNFTAKTGVRTFEAAAFLRRYGADVTRVRKMFRDGALEYKAKAETIRNAEIYKNAYAMGICPALQLLIKSGHSVILGLFTSTTTSTVLLSALSNASVLPIIKSSS